MGPSDETPVPPLGDDVVIDLRDGVTEHLLQQHQQEPTADDAIAVGTDLAHAEEVIDLRDARPPSGRPAELQPGHRMVTITGGDLWMQAEAFVYDIYRQVHYCDESPRHRVEELARWESNSRLHAVMDDEDEVIGVVRTIFGPYADLPVGQFERTDHTHPDPVCELSSLTVRTDVRSTGVIEHLYRAGWLDAFRAGSTTLVALIDDWLLDVFKGTYRLPFDIIGVGQEYMGSTPVPVAMPLQGHEYQVTADENPDFWAWTLEAVQPGEAERWKLPSLDAAPVGERS
ncbi:MAG TPA: hypothetical protein VK507_25000 [Iamia sp.]|nr:hypothetical protein [Iamia sp.]